MPAPELPGGRVHAAQEAGRGGGGLPPRRPGDQHDQAEPRPVRLPRDPRGGPLQARALQILGPPTPAAFHSNPTMNTDISTLLFRFPEVLLSVLKLTYQTTILRDRL